ncbi:MAG: glycoside hydrolase family 11 protein, partial [Ruminococcus sp.]|nr:glycoside hydrolase family 11 protein [Ruminococcus sp.]
MCLTMLPGIPKFSSSAASVGDKLSVGGGTTQHKGNCDGYSYEIWLDRTGGSGTMTLGSGASFKAEWSASVPSGNFLARRGLDFGSQKKATDYSYIGMDYEADYRQTGSANGNSRLCVYGWFQNKGLSGVPLVEYYIIEDWVDWVPDAPGKMVTIDGAQYKIFQMDHTGPSINSSNETFKQYFSVRQQKRKSGHITVSDHFKAWADQGWGIGNLYEVALNAEGWQSSGVADIKKLDVYTKEPIPGTTTPSTPTPTPQQPSKPADGTNYFNDTFESGNGDWESRGATTLTSDSKNYYAGSKSLFVSGREDTWQGAAIPLDSSQFVPGYAYSFSTAILQNSGSTEEAKLTLQYKDASGEECYDTVASANAASGKWTKLENTSYTIPSDATNLLLYVETESTTDFYIDNAVGAVEGTKSSVTTGGGTVAGGTNPPATTPPTTQTPGTSTKPNYSSDSFVGKFGHLFKMGTSVSPHELNSGADFIKKHFNSITPENELKPQLILKQGSTDNTRCIVDISAAAKTLKFCEDNNIGVRGHTFVWYSQTPSWFFKENFSDNGAYVSKEIMNKRLENFIKDTFDAIKTQYPKLNLYAYDVCNE